MEEYTLISKREVRKNKLIKRIQKESNKRYRHTKGRFPKAKLGKLVALRASNNYINLTDYHESTAEVPQLDRSTLLNEMKRQNIRGLGGSGFPSAQKLEAVIASKSANKYLIINGVECDPGLLHDKWLLENRYSEIEKGIGLLAGCADFKKIILATKEEITGRKSCYEIHTVPNRYPMGAERVLIQEVLGFKIADNEIPANKGILVINIQTVHAIYEAIYLKRPADSRFITVADLTTGEAVIARVKLDTGILDLTSRISKASVNLPVFYGGGLLSGKKALAEDKITIGTNFIGYGKEAGIFPNASCKGCGACARKCPMDIKVNKLVQALEKNDRSVIKDLHPERCIKCGTCSYYCAAGKNTMELVNSCGG